jgi:hypothetical protein
LSDVQRTCEELAQRGGLVVMAGAGVSAGWPSAVDPWLLYARIHATRALATLEHFDEANGQLEGIRVELERFPVLESFLFEALWQMQTQAGDNRAAASLATAADCAREAGLGFRCERLTAAAN